MKIGFNWFLKHKFCHKKLSKCSKVKRVEFAVRKKKMKEQKKSAVRSGYIILKNDEVLYI